MQRPPHFWGGLERFTYFPLTYHLLDGVTVEVLDRSDTVVLVQALAEVVSIWNVIATENEWVSNYAVTGLEGNTWLESVRIDCTYHL